MALNGSINPDTVATVNRSLVDSKGLLVAYLAHLLVPVLLVLDIVLSWAIPPSTNGIQPPAEWWHSFGPSAQVLLLACSAWIIAGLILLVASQFVGIFSANRILGPLILVYSIIVFLLLAELMLNVAPGNNHKPALWPPGREALLLPDPDLMPGVEGVGKFTGNDVGLRGPDFPVDSDDVYKIVTIGGSTTEGLYLDDTEEWSNLLMTGLNAESPDAPTWVANGGQSGRNTVDHAELVRVLPVISQAEMLIFLIGINDLGPVLSLAGKSTQTVLESVALDFGNQVTNGGERVRPSRPFFKRTELFSLVKRSSAALLDNLSPSLGVGWLGVGTGRFIEERRQLRAENPTVTLPDIQLGLEEYRARIRTLQSLCDERGLRCLYLTQPMMWRADLTPEEDSLMWFGWVDNGVDPPGYGSIKELAAAMDEFNGELLSVCLEDGLECLDLVPDVPKDTTAFYDDAHFNENGSRIIASLLTDYLSDNPPYIETSK